MDIDVVIMVALLLSMMAEFRSWISPNDEEDCTISASDVVRMRVKIAGQIHAAANDPSLTDEDWDRVRLLCAYWDGMFFLTHPYFRRADCLSLEALLERFL